MTPVEICRQLGTKFGSRIQQAIAVDLHPRIHVESVDWREIAEFMLRDLALRFDWLQCLSGVDYAADGKMAVAYDFWSSEHDHLMAVKVFTPRATASVPSVADLWSAADWQEREAWDMFGIDFPGHPDLRRILMADDWEGFPLRKDYVFPREYHGIPGSVELDWQQQPNYPK